MFEYLAVDEAPVGDALGGLVQSDGTKFSEGLFGEVALGSAGETLHHELIALYGDRQAGVARILEDVMRPVGLGVEAQPDLDPEVGSAFPAAQRPAGAVDVGDPGRGERVGDEGANGLVGRPGGEEGGGSVHAAEVGRRLPPGQQLFS